MFFINLCHSIFGPIPAPGYHPEGMYEFKVDLNGDAVEDLSCRSLTDNAPSVMFPIAANAPVSLGIGKEWSRRSHRLSSPTVWNHCLMRAALLFNPLRGSSEGRIDTEALAPWPKPLKMERETGFEPATSSLGSYTTL